MTEPEHSTVKPALPSTLAQRVQVLRQARGFSLQRLAEITHIALNVLEDIEAGLVLFLSPHTRQKLSKALRVSASTLHAVERPTPEQPQLTPEELDHYWQRIMTQPHQPHTCPQCTALLVIRQFLRRDLEDQPLVHWVVHCSKCLFKLNTID